MTKEPVGDALTRAPSRPDHKSNAPNIHDNTPLPLPAPPPPPSHSHPPTLAPLAPPHTLIIAPWPMVTPAPTLTSPAPRTASSCTLLPSPIATDPESPSRDKTCRHSARHTVTVGGDEWVWLWDIMRGRECVQACKVKNALRLKVSHDCR